MSEGSKSVLLAALFFPAAAAVLVFFMKYLSAVLQARARLSQDEAYRALAQKGTAAQSEIAAALAAFGVTLSNIQSRLTEVERILKAVE